MLNTMQSMLRCACACLAGITIVGPLALSPATSGPPGAQPTSGKSNIVPLTTTWVPETCGDEPYPRYRLGADLRARFVDLQYAEDLGLGIADDATRQWVSIRSRVWLKYDRSQFVSVYARLNNESTRYFGCKSCENRFDEVIFENLFIEARHLFGLPMAARLGRQDLLYGDAFVISDGTPLDQARTTYVNGLLVTSVLAPWSFDAFIIWDRKQEEYLPRINNRYRRLLEFNEIVAGIVLRRLLPDAAARKYMLEHYYIYKDEKGWHKISSIHTLGTRLGFPIWRFRLSAEFAYQAGKAPEYKFSQVRPGMLGRQTILAYGGHTRISTYLGRPLPVDLAGGYIYLSGDDPVTQNKHEGWNPLLGRGPIWSELYIYTLGIERDFQPQDQGIGFWQNLVSPFVEVVITPGAGLRFEAKHMWLSTSQHIARVPVEGDPQERGKLLILRLSWKMPARFFGHLLYERFSPGNLYLQTAKDATLLRLELSTSL